MTGIEPLLVAVAVTAVVVADESTSGNPDGRVDPDGYPLDAQWLRSAAATDQAAAGDHGQSR